MSTKANLNTQKPSRARAKTDEAIRERILDAALRKFWRHGFDGASLSAIAKEAGIAQPHTYYYFEDKFDLWKSAISSPFISIMQLLEDTGDLKDLTPPQRFRARLRRLIGAAISNLEVMHIYMQESGNPGDRLDYLIETYFGPIHTSVADEIRSISREGAPDPTFILASVVGAIHFFFASPDLMAAVHNLDLSDDKVRTEFVDFVVSQVMQATGAETSA